MGSEKTSSDLMDADVAIQWTGTTGKVTGGFPKVTGFTGFSGIPEQQSGHYLCFEVDEQYEGQQISVIGKNKKTAEDRKWVVRLDEVYEDSKKLTVKADGTEIFVLDLSAANMKES